jgi:hypothetical protein
MQKPVVFTPGFSASELRDKDDRVVFPPSPGTLLSACGRRRSSKKCSTSREIWSPHPLRSRLRDSE